MLRWLMDEGVELGVKSVYKLEKQRVITTTETETHRISGTETESRGFLSTLFAPRRSKIKINRKVQKIFLSQHTTKLTPWNKRTG